MRILVACEESQRVTIAFREKGHEAYSCDLLPCSGRHPEWHLQGDCFNQINKGWDLIISFPPCTDLAVSGARWFQKKRLSGEQEASVKFFLDIWDKSNSVENPIGIMNTGEYIKKWLPHLHDYALSIGFPFKPSQIIQPYQFGHIEQKATCLWLKDLPLLKGTKNVYNEMMKLPYGERAKVHYASPGPQRAILRSKTYPGIAEAFASQWG